MSDRFKLRSFRNLTRWPPIAKYGLIVATDIAVYLFSIAFAYFVFRPTELTDVAIDRYWQFVAFGLVVVLASFFFSGLYRQMVRHAGIEVVSETAKAVTIAILFSNLVGRYLVGKVFPLPIAIFLWFCLIIGMAGVRMIARSIIYSDAKRTAGDKERVAIYGAGEGGTQLFDSLLTMPNYEVVGFFDDNPELAGRRIRNFKIYPTEKLEGMVDRRGIQTVILAMPSLSHGDRLKILSSLDGMGVKVQVLPSLKQLLTGNVSVNELRDIHAGDLLWREPHDPDPDLLVADVKDKSVMVTGAGGSIGSQLCRLAIENGATRLVMADFSELNLYRIEQELGALATRHGDKTELICALVDCKDEEAIHRQMAGNEVETVYHAAAYKHVPITEHNIAAGIRNNVFGTLASAQAAISAGVGKFVFISTDKAVRPTNIMGATKRLSEMILQGLHAKLTQDSQAGGKPATIFTMVRFGNVLDSAGSVVPLFRRQIEEGGPITLTHRDVTRFFMTIPEAAGLVLQAGAMAKGGEVHILDMGEPVKIYDLARKMISLSGHRVAEVEGVTDGIMIEITGMRPGEKLHEELFIGEQVYGTRHPSIMRGEEDFKSWTELSGHLDVLKDLIAREDDEKLVQAMADLVQGYAPARESIPDRRKYPRLVPDTLPDS